MVNYVSKQTQVQGKATIQQIALLFPSLDENKVRQYLNKIEREGMVFSLPGGHEYQAYNW